MRRLLLVASFTLLPTLAFAATNINQRKPADDAPAPLAALSAQQQADLKKVEDYVNGLITVSARFTQVADFGDGTAGRATGHFKLWRPGRLRIDYDAPSGDFIVADGSVIHQWDDQMKQSSQMRIESSLPGFLLRRNLSFNGDDVTVTSVEHPAPDRMEIALRSVAEPEAGLITFVFATVPLKLVGWRVMDASNLTTEVLLEEIKTGESFKRDDFVFKKPASGSGR
jgi:outer membrane lipoprotein-sorting protein